MTSRFLAVGSCALLLGCSIDVEGTGAIAVEFSDSSAGVDTNVAVEDSAAPVEDTSTVPDTEPVDSGAVDTELSDSAPVDSGMPDTAPEDTAPVTTLTVSTRSSAGGNYNLTTEGTRDWAHWGHDMTDSFNRMAMRTAITKGTRMGAGTFESGVFRFSWSNGSADPVAVADTARGLSMNIPGESVTFKVQGDPSTELTLDVWASGTSNGTLTGTLEGTSVAPASVTLGAGIYVVTFKFRTAGKLQVEVKKGEIIGTFNMLAAALK